MLVELLLAAALLGPSSRSLGNRPGSGSDEEERIARISGFATVLVNQVNRTIGSENLPYAQGVAVDPGVFVTLGLKGMQVYDHELIPLQNGRISERVEAEECIAKCSAAFYDAFQLEWLRMSIESATHAVRVPDRVHIAAHSQVPMGTFMDVAYAASETRPITPPTLSILVNVAGRGVRSQPVFLLPPEGLELPQGSAALGFTIKFGSEGGIVVDGSDPNLGRQRRLRDAKQLPAILKMLRKRYPNKQVVILEPEASVTVGELMAMITAVRTAFPRIVLSQGQQVIL